MIMMIMIMILLLTSLQSGSSFTSYMRLITTNQIKCWLAFNEHMHGGHNRHLQQCPV